MSRSKLLFLSPFFYPEKISTGKWNTSVVKKLARKSDVTVFCLHPLYPDWKIDRSNDTLDGVNIVRRGRYLIFPKSQILRRLTLELYFFFSSFFYLIKNKNKFDKLVFIFPPSLMGVLGVKLFKGVKVGIVHDLQGVYANNSNSLIGKILGKLIHLVESVAFSKCQRLIFLSNEMMKDAILAYGLNSDKCHVSYPFVTIDNFESRDSLIDVFDSSKVNVVYSGALGEKQNVSGLIDFLSLCTREIDSVHVHIFSQGPKFEHVKKECDVDDSKFFFHDLVDEKDLPELLLRSDIQVLPQAAGTSAGSLPSKLPNIIASNCKLLVITDNGSELSHLLKGIEGVFVSNVWGAEELVSNLIYLINETDYVGKNRSALIDLLNVEIVLKQINESSEVICC